MGTKAAGIWEVTINPAQIARAQRIVGEHCPVVNVWSEVVAVRAAGHAAPVANTPPHTGASSRREHQDRWLFAQRLREQVGFRTKRPGAG
jgi:hypothetical protein